MARIFLIEDDEPSRYLIRVLLETRHHSVVEARTGREAIALAHDLRVDLILLDLRLPCMDGLDLLVELSRILGGDRAPVVALTAYAGTAERAKALAAGCVGYIEKPIESAAFGSQIEALLPRRDESS